MHRSALGFAAIGVLLVSGAVLASCGGDSTTLGGAPIPADAANEPAQDASPEAGDEPTDDVAAPDAADEPVEDATPADAADEPAEDASVDAAPDVLPDAAGGCGSPLNPSLSALCLKLIPEALTLVAGNEALDGKGVWIIQVYDMADPKLADGGDAQPLATKVLPEQDAGTNPPLTMGIYDDPGEVRFDGLPPTVYVRAFFADNFAALGAGGPTYGLWLGGIDTSNGLFGTGVLNPIALWAGQASEKTLDVIALRRITMKLQDAPTLNAFGDGQGPASFALFADQQIGNQDGGSAPGYGYGKVPCGDLFASGGITIDGVFIGNGPYYTFGFVDDLGTGSGTPGGFGAGTILDLEATPGGPQIPSSAKLTIPFGAYEATGTVNLNFALPGTGQLPPDTTQCSSLSDAGAD